MKINIDTPPDLEAAALAFSALGSEQRLGVLRALVRCGPAGLSIGELGKVTGISGSTLTHHVKFLTLAGLVNQTKKGRSIICAAVSYDRVQALADFLVSECCSTSTGETHNHHGKNND